MNKRILMLGCGSKAGAWQIRGAQLGMAIEAQVLNGLDNANLIGLDLVVAVKRPRREDIARLHAAGIPVVWDIVDAWPQPIGNWWTRDACMTWLKAEVRRIQPVALVATTQVMAKDCTQFGIPVLVLLHHHRPHLSRTPIRDQIKVVGYEGGTQYLGYWEHILRDTCRTRGWDFHATPASLSVLDIVVAVREPDGYAARNWKSNVKLANAQGSGTPCVMNRESAYLETASGAELWADDMVELEAAFDTLRECSREDLSERLFQYAPHLESVAATYRQWLEAL